MKIKNIISNYTIFHPQLFHLPLRLNEASCRFLYALWFSVEGFGTNTYDFHPKHVHVFSKGITKGKRKDGERKLQSWRKSRCRKRSNSVIRSFWKKIRKCRKRPFRSSCRKDCKSSVSNGNMPKQDGWDRQRKPQRKQRRSPGIFLQRQPERYRRLHQKMFRFCLL